MTEQQVHWAVIGIASIFGLGLGIGAFIAWWSTRGETYRRRG